MEKLFQGFPCRGRLGYKSELMPYGTDEISDADCARRATSGDEGAFEILFARYYEPVRGFACRMLGNDDGDDVAQETFVRVGREIRSLTKPEAVRSWIFRIAANLSKDAIRRRESKRKHLDAFAVDAGAVRADGGYEALDAALLALPNPQREAVLLVFFENLSHREAAHALGCAEATVSWRIMLAKRKLKTLLSR